MEGQAKFKSKQVYKKDSRGSGGYIFRPLFLVPSLIKQMDVKNEGSNEDHIDD